MKLIILSLFTLLNIPILVFAQSGDTPEGRIMDFVTAVGDPDIDAVSIITDFLCIDTITLDEAEDTERTSLIVWQLEDLRDSLSKLDISAISIIPYADFDAFDKKFQLKPENKQYVYGVEYDDEIIAFVYLKKNRIYSFTAMQMGSQGHRVFILYCQDK